MKSGEPLERRRAPSCKVDQRQLGAPIVASLASIQVKARWVISAFLVRVYGCIGDHNIKPYVRCVNYVAGFAQGEHLDRLWIGRMACLAEAQAFSGPWASAHHWGLVVRAERGTGRAATQLVIS